LGRGDRIYSCGKIKPSGSNNQKDEAVAGENIVGFF